MECVAVLGPDLESQILVKLENDLSVFFIKHVRLHYWQLSL